MILLKSKKTCFVNIFYSKIREIVYSKKLHFNEKRCIFIIISVYLKMNCESLNIILQDLSEFKIDTYWITEFNFCYLLFENDYYSVFYFLKNSNTFI